MLLGERVQHGVVLAAVVHVHEDPAADARGFREPNEARGVRRREGVALEVQAQHRSRQRRRGGAPTATAWADGPPREGVVAPPPVRRRVRCDGLDEGREVRDDVVEGREPRLVGARVSGSRERRLRRAGASRGVGETFRVRREHDAVGGEDTVHVEARDALAPHGGHPGEGPVPRGRRVVRVQWEARHPFELMRADRYLPRRAALRVRTR
mmetsp:Transcript_2653/g.10790  ORF Transcript_2653/g.10790 Transcript_2653/m.10790 type:complete len:210 (-) Transcript_2653:34-663(-)